MQKLTYLSLILFLAVGAALAKEKIDLEFTSMRGGLLEIDLEKVEGQITIEGRSGDDVPIKGESWGGRDRCGLDIWERRSGVNISHDCRSERDAERLKVDLVIQVPERFDIKVKGVAETKIHGVQGRFEINVANASVELSQLEGEISLNTANGRVTIVDSQLEGEISNVNGKLKILKSSVGGRISTVNATQEVSEAHAGLEVKSVNGGIDIGSARELVRANSVNGSVEIGELDGAIEAETVNGNVSFEMVGGHDIDIETTNGEVDLRLPQDFSMAVDIKIRNKGGRREFYQIFSDFDIEVEEDVRRYDAVARGRVGGGKNRVRIYTTNGDVRLRKAR